MVELNLSLLSIPWWYMLTFGLLILSLAILAYIFYRYRIRRNKDLLAATDVQSKQLEDLYNLKTKFLANISHEFRTPLTLILGPADHLLTKIDDPDDREQLHRIKRNSRKLLKLINQLLDLSRIEAGEFTLRFSHLDIGLFCLQIASAFESLASQRKIDLIVDAQTGEHHVYFDPEKMEHVINNLLNNALKFTDKGSVSLVVKAITANGQPAVEISITDTGIGIHPDKQPFVFDRFYQASEHSGLEYEGTGIGLSLCKELVEMHGGHIGVRSAVGAGATFHITVPQGRAHLNDDQIVPASTYEVGGPMVAGSAVTGDMPEAKDSELPDVLIVDDNRDMLDFLAHQLGNEYDVWRAIDGKHALEIAHERIPDIIISDVMMPVMNGFELCEALKNDIRTDHIPVILLTAMAGTEHRIEGLQAAADDYVQKPFSSAELLARMANLIENRRRLRNKYADLMTFKPAEVASSPREAEFLQALNELIETHISDSELDVGMLSQQLGMSKSQLNRKLKNIAGRSPNAYIRSYRLDRARQLMDRGGSTIAEIAYDVGFSSPAYFSKCFKDAYGHAPSEIQSEDTTG
jgi:signal transduction histidine kinase/DNA-binding response OmpR family regulator